MEALRVYASTPYRTDIEMLTTLINKLETPKIEVPQDPEVTVKKEKRELRLRRYQNFKKWFTMRKLKNRLKTVKSQILP